MTTIDNSRLTMAADYIREHGWTQGTMKDAAGAVCDICINEQAAFTDIVQLGQEIEGNK